MTSNGKLKTSNGNLERSHYFFYSMNNELLDRLLLLEEEEEEEDFGQKSQPEQVKKTRSECFQLLFREHDTAVAKEASRKERKENGYISSTLVYGEVDFDPFTALLQQLHVRVSILFLNETES